MDESSNTRVQDIVEFRQTILFCIVVAFLSVCVREVCALREEEELDGVASAGEVSEVVGQCFLIGDPISGEEDEVSALHPPTWRRAVAVKGKRKGEENIVRGRMKGKTSV